MTRTDLDDILLLEEQFADAMTRMYAVGNGLAALRSRASYAATLPARPVAPAPSTAPVPAASPSPMPAPSPTPVPVPAASPAPVPVTAHVAPPATVTGQPTPSEQVPVWWQREGMVVRLLGVAGAGVLLIGVALLLAFAIEHGYLGPAARVGGAALLAVALLGTAMRLHRNPARAAGSIAIAAAGYATAYLDIVAATTVYHWLPPVAGLALGGLAAGSGVVLARAWNRQLLALVTVGGVAALAPAVARGDHLLTAAFLVVLALAAYPAHIGKDWYLLHAVRVLPAALALIVVAESVHTRGLLAWAVAFAAADLGTQVLAARIDSGTRLLTPLVVASAVPLLPVAQAADLDLWVVAAPAAIACLLAGQLSGRVRPVHLTLDLAPWATGLGTFFAVVAVATGVGHDWVLPGLLLLACAYAAAAHLRPHAWMRWAALAVAAIGLAKYVPSLVLVLDRRHIGALDAGNLLASALVLALAILLPPLVQAALADHATDPGVGGPAGHLRGGVGSTAEATGRTARLGLTWSLLLTGAGATLVTACVLLGRAVDGEAGGFVVGHGLATLLWAAGAAYLLMHGLRRTADATVSVRLGLALAALAVGKLLLFDLAALDGIVRIAAFIGAGLALLAMGTGYAQALERTRRPAGGQS
ncbi:MAG: DUF2339 domain-containing protein [Dermatophilaceae bacterium]